MTKAATKGGEGMAKLGTPQNRSGHMKLRGRIAEAGYTLSAFCVEAGFVGPTLSCKLTGRSPFSVPEIKRIAKVLSIPDDEIATYFFKED